MHREPSRPRPELEDRHDLQHRRRAEVEDRYDLLYRRRELIIQRIVRGPDERDRETREG